MNHPPPPTKPCPRCGEDLPERVALAYRELYEGPATLVHLQGLGRSYRDGASPLQDGEEEAFDAGFLCWAGASVWDFLDAVRHRLNDE